MENKQFERLGKHLKIPNLIFKNDMEMKVKEQMAIKDHDMEQRRMLQRTKERVKERQLLEDRRMRSQELRYRIDEHEVHRKAVCDKKEEIVNRREQGLRDQQVCLDERLRELNEESERKKRQHEKDMLILDLTKMRVKEKSIDKSEKDLDDSIVAESIKKYENKLKRGGDLKQKLQTERQNRSQVKSKKWAEIRENIISKEYVIDPAKHQTISLSSKFKERSSDKEKVVLKQTPTYLARFTLNLDKINFYEHGLSLTSKLNKSQRNR